MVSTTLGKNHFPIGKYCANEIIAVYVQKKAILIGNHAENGHN
jgi:hypothetical protein